MGFKEQASQHLRRFKENILKVSEYDAFPHMLTDQDALKGLNFYHSYPGFMEAVRRRYKSFRRPMYKNMLRSEHIPFNFFVPLHCNLTDERVSIFFKEVFPNLDIQQLQSIEIEKSPEKKGAMGKGHQYLDDNTSFDVLVLYQSSNGLEALGIEIKYTEKSYPYGDLERERMFSWSSLYHKRHINSGIYKPNTIPILIEPKLKQLWRNHLLGLAMIQNGDIKRFTSVHMYPNGNTYQAQAAKEYLDLLQDECKSTFHALTFEEFIVIGQEVFNEDPPRKHWFEYLEQRYLF